jgi:hypothetical protein
MNSVRLGLTALAVALVVPCSALHSQASSPLVAGARVRITAPTALAPTRQAGTVLGLAGDSLVLRLEGRKDSVTLPMREVTKLDVSRGEHSHGATGAVFGALAGLVVGVVVEARVSSGSDTGSNCKDAGCALLTGAAAAGAAAGAAIGNALIPIGCLAAGAIGGGIIGLAFESERWEHVQPLPSGRVSLVPTANGSVALSLNIRF